MEKMKFLLMALFLLTMQATANDSNLPTRSECIVKIVFDAPINGALTGDDSNIISEFIYSGIYNSGQIKLVAGQSTIRNTESSISVFVQYTENCEQRVQLAEEIINNAVFTEQIIVGYGVSREIIKPGLDTIDVKASNTWKD